MDFTQTYLIFSQLKKFQKNQINLSVIGTKYEIGLIIRKVETILRNNRAIDYR